MEMAYLVKIEGRVTGVGFRYSAVEYASELETLRGYIRNSGYGQVEALIQGSDEDTEMMLEWLGQGPVCARVDDISVERVPVDPARGRFAIAR